MDVEQRRRHTPSENPKINYLTEYLDIDGEIKALIRLCDKYLSYRNRARDCFDRATKATSRMTATRVSGTSAHDSMANAVCQMIEYEEYANAHMPDGDAATALCEKIKEYTNLLRDRLRAINTVPDARMRRLLLNRYIDGWSWENIARDMMYDRTWVWKIHGEALNLMKIIS